MKYPNGVEVKVGDKVRFEREGASGTVEAIIGADFSNWSVNEPGVMLLSAPFGRVFISAAMFFTDEVAPE
jgi:plastocyanin